jgi:triosephosphate isomerase
MRQPCFVANWKMHKTIPEALDYLRTLEKSLRDLPSGAWEAILAPPFTALAAVSAFLKGISASVRIGLAAQNVHYEEAGAHTGEISPLMLRDVGCQYVIIGHSERRVEFGETDRLIHRKIEAAFRTGLAPILCVGEKGDERKAGKTLAVIHQQLKEGLPRNPPDQKGPGLMIAYEPVWAIGTGETPQPSEVEAVHQEIRKVLQSAWGEAEASRILYGGSVNLQNIASFMKEADIDGVLVGGASLSAETFSKMIALGTEAKKQ